MRQKARKYTYEKATRFALGNTEFKSVYLNKLSAPVRINMAERIQYFLTKNNCFVGGFYTTVDSYALYHLRTEVGFDDKMTKLPPDWSIRFTIRKGKAVES